MILGLEPFGLNPRALFRLGRRRVSYCVELRGPALRGLFPLTPRERTKRVRQHLRASIESLASDFEFKAFSPRPGREPWNIDAVSGAATVEALSRSPLVRTLDVTSVSGFRKRALAADLLYTVRVRVAIQVEGRVRGLQGVEERFVVVPASSEQAAIQKLAHLWRDDPYLNRDGEFVRWHMEKILEVYATFEREWSPSGTEVYSRITERRLNASRAWRPRRFSA